MPIRSKPIRSSSRAAAAPYASSHSSMMPESSNAFLNTSACGTQRRDHSPHLSSGTGFCRNRYPWIALGQLTENTRSAHAVRVYFDHGNRDLCTQCPLARHSIPAINSDMRIQLSVFVVRGSTRDCISYPSLSGHRATGPLPEPARCTRPGRPD